MKEKRVSSVKEIDMRGLFMPVIAVYEHPDDFPDKYVARVFDVDRPTDTVVVKDSLLDIQRDIGENTCRIFVPRGAEDVRSLVGGWSAIRK